MAKSDKKAAKAKAAADAQVAVPAPAPQPVVAEPRGTALTRVVEQVGGARLCYGDPVVQGERTIIPVARVRAIGGFGWGGGRGDEKVGDGGAGAGRVRVVPVGFIDVGPDGSNYTAITDPVARARTIAMAAAGAISLAGAATVTVAGAVAAARMLRVGRRTRPALRRGR